MLNVDKGCNSCLKHMGFDAMFKRDRIRRSINVTPVESVKPNYMSANKRMYAAAIQRTGSNLVNSKNREIETAR